MSHEEPQVSQSAGCGLNLGPAEYELRVLNRVDRSASCFIKSRDKRAYTWVSQMKIVKLR
jgi:hypothetical protein